MITTIAIADEKFNKILDPDLLGKCKDINEIVRLVVILELFSLQNKWKNQFFKIIYYLEKKF